MMEYTSVDVQPTPTLTNMVVEGWDPVKNAAMQTYTNLNSRPNGIRQVWDELKGNGMMAFGGAIAWCSTILVLACLMFLTRVTVANNLSGLLGHGVPHYGSQSASIQLCVMAVITLVIGGVGLGYWVKELCHTGKPRKMPYVAAKSAAATLMILVPASIVTFGVFGLKGLLNMAREGAIDNGKAPLIGKVGMFWIMGGILAILGVLALVAMALWTIRRIKQPKETRPSVRDLLLPFLLFVALIVVLVWGGILLNSLGVRAVDLFRYRNGIGSSSFDLHPFELLIKGYTP
ncbi:hypothetical protein NEHOM01_0956 [Nematocida homosporus]|uniref:uncharacterized protein n=1 Tax=Nematocida homosporus TaxID=1912981 RepID=UPI00221EA7DE|nr:uncharacterized protein NEHOM01_0956 [Nematocida homosporus]KAI5185630.1 hypothetical protein NEHOM01_0956 [Nematocida homosporus]